ncbi:peptidoglycan DD-metalloendopeptidase family protein [Pedobacter sp. AW31-3R]|uniref:peptidoglycan DD-metalloendopeptidase family protein n=1 Tax=Pedobacter sp. AW31-3R TaxID=3445781 RepID=UPI003FA0F707
MKIPSKILRHLFLYTFIISSIFSCKSGSVNLFKPASPHEVYKRKLSTAGLDKTAMGISWINASAQSLRNALSITIPFRETGYFAAEKIPATAYRFTATQGQKLLISLSKTPADQFMIYADLWEDGGTAVPKLLQSADTLDNNIQFEVKTTGTYLLRLQPELLRSGQYTLEITSGPSLGFPVKSTKANIGSFFGDGRDANSRKHEGIDIFATFRTPVIAAAEGTVVRVNENNLGGRVVWLRPRDKDYTLYYAHLDEQIAIEGQQVSAGDTLGLMGNTGNAKTTAPHLHFGIYTSNGAIDPLPYVNPVINNPLKITGSLDYLNATARTLGRTILRQSPAVNSPELSTLKSGTIMKVNAASGMWFTVELPDGLTGFIQTRQASTVTKPLRKIKINTRQQQVYDRPDTLAAVKLILPQGRNIAVLGDYEDYQFIEDENRQTGWIKM